LCSSSRSSSSTPFSSSLSPHCAAAMDGSSRLCQGRGQRMPCRARSRVGMHSPACGCAHTVCCASTARAVSYSSRLSELLSTSEDNKGRGWSVMAMAHLFQACLMIAQALSSSGTAPTKGASQSVELLRVGVARLTAQIAAAQLAHGSSSSSSTARKAAERFCATACSWAAR
jgi:hypothetical protein